jgi:hypothetical protein
LEFWKLRPVVLLRRLPKPSCDALDSSASAEGLVGVSTLDSRRLARPAVLRELRVGAITFRDEAAVVVQTAGAGNVEGDGLLPLHWFSRVAFSNSLGYMVVGR